MSTQTVPLEALQKIRQHIKSAIALPEMENSPKFLSGAEPPPEPHSLNELGSLFNFGSAPEETLHMPNTKGLWFITATNPGSVFMKLPGLKLKSSLRLVGYLYRMGKDGVGKIWAVPEAFSTTSHLEKALLNCNGQDNPPKPQGTLEDFMEAIDGDYSAMSFVIASILRRELLEFGALGKSARWRQHRFIDRLPAQPKGEWQWRGNPIINLSPKVRVFPDGKIALEFFTCRMTTSIAIRQHVDLYPAGQYQAKSIDQTVAVLQPEA